MTIDGETLIWIPPMDIRIFPVTLHGESLLVAHPQLPQEYWDNPAQYIHDYFEREDPF